MKYIEGYTQVDVNDISLDPNNPRHNPVEDDKNALEELMKTKKFNSKIIALMKDILEYGQNPIDIIGLLLTDKNTLYSKEGNRRVAAIKILNNPELIKGTNDKLYSHVINLLQDYQTPPVMVMCYITKDTNILDHAMELKHQGEQDGAGTVSWGANEKSRHKRNKGMKDAIYAFLNSLEDAEILSSSTRKNITKTNWERLFTQDGQAWLGIKKINDKYEIVTNSDDFKFKFKLVTDRIEGESHHIITNFEARRKLFSELDIEFKQFKEMENADEDATIVVDDSAPENDIKIGNSNKQEETPNNSNSNSDYNDDKSEDDESPQASVTKPVSKSNPSKYRLGELYVAFNSKIPKEQHTAFINIHKELEKLAGGQYGYYKTYKLSTYYLIRALIEQCLKYWLSVYYPKLYSKCSGKIDVNLGKMIEEVNKALNSNTDVFFNSNINRKFTTFFANLATKDTLDLLIHHPYLLSDDINILHNYTSGILFDILNHILTYEEK